MGAPDRRDVRGQLRRVPPQCPGPHGGRRARSGPSARRRARQSCPLAQACRSSGCGDMTTSQVMASRGSMDAGAAFETPEGQAALEVLAAMASRRAAADVGGAWLLIADLQLLHVFMSAHRFAEHRQSDGLRDTFRSSGWLLADCHVIGRIWSRERGADRLHAREQGGR